MKGGIGRYIFWIGLAIVLLAIGGSYFVLVNPKRQETGRLGKELDKQLKDLKRFANKPELPNASWHEVARDYVQQMKAQQKQCQGLLVKYECFWDKPFKKYEKWDRDVFISVYETQRAEFLESVRGMIKLSKDAPLSWPSLGENGTEDAAMNIQRYFWVQMEIVDMVVAGEARELLSLSIPRSLRSEEDPEPIQSINYKLKVRTVYQDLPALFDSLLSLDRKLLCFVDTMQITKDVDALPVLKPDMPLEEPPVTVSLTGRVYLFHKAAEPEEEKSEEEDAAG